VRCQHHRHWLQANPNDELANEVRALLTTEPVRHVTDTRQYLGWGVFALMGAEVGDGAEKAAAPCWRPCLQAQAKKNQLRRAGL